MGRSMSAPVKPAKVIDPAKAGKFSFEIMAYTDVIGGNVTDTKYAKELLTIDPFAELENDCLIVCQFSGGSPHMALWSKTGKDEDGKFARRGADNEAFRIHFGVTYTKAAIGEWINILGRVVSDPREFPKEMPISYSSYSSLPARAA